MVQKLKYLGFSVVCQEVPDEISLTINVSGCPVRCQGCHSKYLWEYNGNYLTEDIEKLLQKYIGMVTCICFMGGDQNYDELSYLCQKCKEYGYKTCLYTGHNMTEQLKLFSYENLNYLKVGEYIEEYGGLNNPHTNQKMYKVTNRKMIDITNMFWRI